MPTPNRTLTHRSGKVSWVTRDASHIFRYVLLYTTVVIYTAWEELDRPEQRMWLCQSLTLHILVPHKKPALQESRKPSGTLRHPRVPHSHSTSCKALTKLWLGLAHPNTTSSTHAHRCNSLTRSSLSTVWLVRGPTGHPVFQTDARLSPPLELLHLRSTHEKSFDPASCPLADNYWSELFKVVWILVQDGLGIPPTKHMPTYTLLQSTPSNLSHQIVYQIMPLFHSITLILWGILTHFCKN